MKAVIAGATGLIGSYLVEQLKSDGDFDQIRALTRSPVLPESKFGYRVNYEDQDSLRNALAGSDVAFCALGTTMKNAGSKDAFRRVDFDYVINFSEAAREAGVKSIAVVSSMGASGSSSFFYNRVKGDMESALRDMNFPRLILVRPSVLFGPRKERRFAEGLGIAVGRFLSPIMVGPMKDYRPVHAKFVARAMVRAIKKDAPEGTHVLTWPDFKDVM